MNALSSFYIPNFVTPAKLIGVFPRLKHARGNTVYSVGRVLDS